MSNTIRKWILYPATLLLLTVSGCTSVREAHSRVEYVSVYERDSVWVDCTDTLYIFERGDTVRILKTKTVREYRYKILTDTARVTDTVTVEKVTTLRSPETAQRKVRRWPWFCAGFISAVLIIFAIRILIKIYLKR